MHVPLNLIDTCYVKHSDYKIEIYIYMYVLTIESNNQSIIEIANWSLKKKYDDVIILLTFCLYLLNDIINTRQGLLGTLEFWYWIEQYLCPLQYSEHLLRHSQPYQLICCQLSTTIFISFFLWRQRRVWSPCNTKPRFEIQITIFDIKYAKFNVLWYNVTYNISYDYFKTHQKQRQMIRLFAVETVLVSSRFCLGNDVYNMLWACF